MSKTAERAKRERGRADRKRTSGNWALAAIVRWRDWSIPVKLIAVMLVPVITTLALGIVVINAQMAKAAVYVGADGLTQLSDNARSAISALQQERQQIAQDNATMTPAAMPANMPDSATKGSAKGATAPKPGVNTAPKPDPALAGIQHEVDLALTTLRQSEASNAARAGFDPVAATAWIAATRQLDELPALRAAEGAQGANASAQVDSYTQLIDGLFAFDRVLATDLGDPHLTREAMALYDLFSAREEVRYQQAVVLVGIGHGTMTVADVTSLHGSEARLASRISDFHTVAAQDAATDYQKAVSGTVLSQQGALLGEAIDQSGGMSGQVMPGMVIRIPLDTWNSANRSVTTGLTSVTDTLATQLRGTAATMQGTASNTAGTAAVVLFVALLVAALIMVIVARQLLRSIGVLRRGARDVATRQLPEAVERIQAGETVDIAVTPVPVHTKDEVGQLARAFDAVHAEALKLAVEQANLRGNYSDLFTNLSRRSQGLVQRQLRLIEQLERDEEDPDQLSALFKLDHLATRMRRNNENLMVLSGGELGRGPTQAMPLSDLLRAAVSEIEQYQRVSVQPPPGVHILGYAAGDLVRLIAELLDNATAFSAPDTQVTIASHRTRSRAVVVDIVDHGIGMGDDDLRAANERLGESEGFEGRITRRMGLFVVSKLAGQHGVRVRLHGGEDIPGLRVTVTLPAQLIVGDEDAVIPLPSAEPEPKGKRDASMNAITVTIPQLPSASESGVNLFAPLPGSATAEDAEEAPEPEPDRAGATTPIFDDMLSAWFDAAKPIDAQSEDDNPPEDASFAGRSGWRFAADDGWKAADSITQASPEAYTAAGLPKRQPKARLLPGSADAAGTPQQAAQQAQAGPGAEKMRKRLTGFQRGVQKGRHQINEVGAGEPEWPAENPDSAFFAGDQPAGNSDLVNYETENYETENYETGNYEIGISVEAIDAAESTAGSTVEDDAATVSSDDSGSSAVNADSLEDTAIWPTAADEGWEAAEEALTPTPSALTPAGLPRRKPRAQLVPGSVATKGPAVMAGVDAGAVRDRLSSFQRGVRQGRDGSAAADGIEHGFEWEND
ncbi:MAG TPA: nitrate- and nitrite sensing domain-containing protein [Pseudonocardiaceae bacterium]|nr:nitrate- and nitrite sensing domain-containing protein [Pseudonocardiaceae bacterium]